MRIRQKQTVAAPRGSALLIAALVLVTAQLTCSAISARAALNASIDATTLRSTIVSLENSHPHAALAHGSN